MDFTVTKLTENVEDFQLARQLRIGLKLITFAYMVLLALGGWTFISLCYVALLIYWIVNLDQGIKNLKRNAVKKDGNKYYNLVKLMPSNPKVRFYFKVTFLVLLILLIKVCGSIINSMKYVTLNKQGNDPDNIRSQLMLDLDISNKQDDFTFKDLIQNILEEGVLIVFLLLILVMESTMQHYTKRNVDNTLARFGKKWIVLAQVVHCSCLFLMPVVSKSPLTMAPLSGLVVALLIIYYKGKSYTSLIWIPKLTIFLTAVALVFFKIKTLETFLGNKFLNEYFFSTTDSAEADKMNRLFLVLCVLAALFFQLFEYFTVVVQLRKQQAFVQTIGALLIQHRPASRKDNLNPLIRNLPMKSDKFSRSSGPAHVVELENRNSQNTNEFREPPSGLTDKSDAKDFFKGYFCKNFDNILKVNRAETMNFELKISSPVILELKDYVDLKKKQKLWAQSVAPSKSSKARLKIVKAWRWFYSYFKLLMMKITHIIVTIFTNQLVVISIETLMAIIFVINSPKSVAIYPILFWIFLNVYPAYNSSLSLNLKIWLLMIPTAYACVLAKNDIKEAINNSDNSDFNFQEAPEYRVLDISAVGVVLIAFVILEMILIGRRISNRGDELTGTESIISSPVESDTDARQPFSAFTQFLVTNSYYLILLNVILIALNINLINLGLILFFIDLILTRDLSKVTAYLLFWYNQLCILLIYTYNLYRTYRNNRGNPLSQSELSYFVFIGVEDDEDVFFRAFKDYVNFTLQIFLIIFIFKHRNEDLMREIVHENYRQKMKISLSTNSWKMARDTLVEIFEYAFFHSLPWVSYLVIFVSMIYTPPTLITVLELIVLSFVLCKHLFKSIDNRFGGILSVKGAWKFQIFFSAFLTLARYLFWFSILPYVNGKKWDLTSYILSNDSWCRVVGLKPSNNTKTYLDLLPSFLTMYLGSIILNRVKQVEFTIAREEEIKQVDVYLPPEAPMLVLVREQNLMQNFNYSTMNPVALIQERHEMNPTTEASRIDIRPEEENIDKLEEKYKLLYARKVVLGDIRVFKPLDERREYLFLKILTTANFLVTAYLATHFRLSLSMFSLLAINLYYFWSCHTKFVDQATDQDLNGKIMKRLMDFYKVFINRKKGLMSGNEKKMDSVIHSDVEISLKLFTVKIRRGDIQRRVVSYRAFALSLCIIMFFCYLSKFTGMLTDYKDITKWLNTAMMAAGVLVHSQKTILDIYGYLIVFLFTVAEINLSRNLERLIKEAQKTNKLFSVIRQSQDQDLDSNLDQSRGQSKSTLTKYVIKIKDGGNLASILPPVASVVGASDLNADRPIMKIGDFKPYTLVNDFLGSHEHPIAPSELSQNVQEIHLPIPEQPNLHPPVIDYKRQNNKFGKLLYFFENRDLYLNCKMYMGGIYLMFRLAFFILISISDKLDCLVSFLTLVYLCYIWYSSADSPIQRVRYVNRLAVIVIAVKYLIACLNIRQSNYVGDKMNDMETSAVCILLGSTDSPYMPYFEVIIGKSMTGLWLLSECLIFVAVQLMIFFYTVILRINTSELSKRIVQIKHMISKYVHSSLSAERRKPFIVNFNRWYSPRFKYAEFFLKMGTVYLPIASIMVLVSFSQYYSSVPIVFVIGLGLALSYQLIFSWYLHLLSEQPMINRYFTLIKISLWGYILLGSLTRLLSKVITDKFSSFQPLGHITLVVVISLISFQVIADLWESQDFCHFYSEFLDANKLNSLAVPLCQAYEFNEEKIRKMVNNLKSKDNLDRRIRVMEKQLKIWHIRNQSIEENIGDNEQTEAVRNQESWEKEILDLDQEEENLVLQMRNEAYLMDKVSLLDKIINYLFSILNENSHKFHISPHLYLMHIIKTKNSGIISRELDFNIYDYIGQDYNNYIDFVVGVMDFYNRPEDVKDKLKECKDNDAKIMVANKLRKLDVLQGLKEEVGEKDVEKLKEAGGLLAKIVQTPKQCVRIDMTQSDEYKQGMQYFDSKVDDLTLRFYNIVHNNHTGDIGLYNRLDRIHRLGVLVQLLPSYILSKSQSVTLALIVLYCLIVPTPIKLALLIFVLLKGITEEMNLKRKFWQVCFILISGNMFIKVLAKALLGGTDQNTDPDANGTTNITTQGLYAGVVQFFCGNVSFEPFELIAFFAIVLRVLQSQFDGGLDQYAIEYENVSQAFIRLKVNKKFEELWDTDYKQRMQYLDSVKALYQDKQSKKKSALEKAFSNKFELSEEVILEICDQNIKKRDKDLQKKVVELITPRMEQTFLNFPKKYIEDSMWRKFSKYVIILLPRIVRQE